MLVCRRSLGWIGRQVVRGEFFAAASRVLAGGMDLDDTHRRLLAEPSLDANLLLSAAARAEPSGVSARGTI